MYFIKKNKPLVFLLHPFVVPMLALGRGVCSAFQHWGGLCMQSNPVNRAGAWGLCDGLSAGSPQALPSHAGPLGLQP